MVARLVPPLGFFFFFLVNRFVECLTCVWRDLRSAGFTQVCAQVYLSFFLFYLSTSLSLSLLPI